MSHLFSLVLSFLICKMGFSDLFLRALPVLMFWRGIRCVCPTWLLVSSFQLLESCACCLGAMSSSPGDPSPATRIPRKPKMGLHYERHGHAPPPPGRPRVPVGRRPGTRSAESRCPSKARHLQTLRLYRLSHLSSFQL